MSGGAFLNYPVDHGEIFNLVAMDFNHTEWEHGDKSIVPGKREDLLYAFRSWGQRAHQLIDVSLPYLKGSAENLY